MGHTESLNVCGQQHQYKKIQQRNHLLCVTCHMCVSVCLSLFMQYILRPILPPLPEVGCPKFLEIWNPWGKVLVRNGLRIEHSCYEEVLNRRVKKNCFFLLIWPYKTWWKPRFPMDQRPWVKGYIANFGISLDVFEFFRLGFSRLCNDPKASRIFNIKLVDQKIFRTLLLTKLCSVLLHYSHSAPGRREAFLGT